jgi:streptogramin lyase
MRPAAHVPIAACPLRSSPTEFSAVTSIPRGLLLLTLLSGIGCARSLPAARTPSSLSLVGHVVYRHYDGARSGGGLPLSIDLDSSGNAWVLGEFHTHLQYIDKASPGAAATSILIPHHANANPFYYTAATKLSVSGESVVYGSNDDIVWFSQGGALGFGLEINHSRVVSYDPNTTTFKAYNIPGDRNEVVGLYWDQARNWIWATEYGAWADTTADPVPHQGAIIAFDPDTAKFDNNWQWENGCPDSCVESDPDLSNEVCTGAETPTADGCYKRFDLPSGHFDTDPVGAFSPAHLVADSSGVIWFTNFLGSTIGRLNPATEAVALYPLKAAIGTSAPTAITGPGPWEIRISPDGNYVVWNEFFDSTLARMPLSRWNDSACHVLDGGGDNPCVEEMLVPADLVEQRVHSIDYDADGRLWFTQDSGTRPAIMTNSIGYVTPDWSQVVVADRSNFTPNFNPSSDKTFTGIAIDPNDGEIWVNEFHPPGVGRLTPVDRDVDPAIW